MPDTTRTRGGVRTPALAHVSADQVSLVGDGTAEHPLRVGAGAGTTSFRATFGGFAGPLLGQVVVATANAPVVGVASVTPGDASAFGLHQAIGVVSRIGGPEDVVVQSAGTVTLTTQQWDAVTGESGGLLRGVVYYLDTAPSAGKLRVTPSVGTWIAQIGVALSETQLQLSSLPAFPILGS